MVANLGLNDLPSSNDAVIPAHQIRALVTDAAAIKRLIRSIDEGHARGCIVPTISEGAESTLSINLGVHCETADVEGADEFRQFWEGVIGRAGDAFVERIGISIEREIRESP